MKFKVKPVKKLNDERIIRSWCIIPRTIGEEKRWLHFSVIRQKVVIEVWNLV